jgi:hypothetical protein
VVSPTTIALPDGIVAAGSCSFGGGPELIWHQDLRGNEDWYVPHDFDLPRTWRSLLHAVEADVLDTPRTVALPVLVGHLAGGLLDGDPRAELLRLGASWCGDTTWLAWRTDRHVRVRGRSDGGLMLPAVLLAIAAADGAGNPTSLALRAFAGRDADRTEATRQLGRDDRALQQETLHALLQAEDSVRLTAIDALVRHGAAEQLPDIVAAAGPERPLATLAAADAVRSLWPGASPQTRQETRAALHRSNSVRLRSIDVERLPVAPHPDARPWSAEDTRPRALFWLSCVAAGLVGLWLRERALARAAD